MKFPIGMMKTSDFDFELPKRFIAQTPIEPRDASRLLVLDRKQASHEHINFYEIGEYLHPGDLLVVNRTRVIPARLIAYKIPTGGQVEILLVKPLKPDTWEVLVKGKKLKVGNQLQIENGPPAEIVQVLDGAGRIVRFELPVEVFIGTSGQTPLPPYIQVPLKDPERYQTVYADFPGSVAAPTAGLHFTEGLMERLQKMGVNFTSLTLHVGLDTFAPVMEENPQEHRIHTEWCEVSQATIDSVKSAKMAGCRVIAVGTTSVRAIESAARSAQKGESITEYTGRTDLFIIPGYKFNVVDAMITNFHLPRSTLIMLVSAFAGRDRILEAYDEAKKAGYRFYSFGDAMFII